MSNIGFLSAASCVIGSLSLLSCAGAPAEEPLELAVAWGLNGTAALPGEVTELEIVTCIRDGQEEECDPTSCSVAALTLMRAEGPVESCRPEAGTEMFGDDPVLVRRGLDLERPIRFQLNGKDADGNVIYTGQAGPFVLGEGERRFQRIFMYPVGEGLVIAGSDVGRVLPTSTYLPDGRVLIAGGFDVVEALSACPEALAFPEGTTCFEMTATDRAVVFDVASRAVVPVANAMLSARGGHSATTLPDGRVLLAGGAASAILATIPQGAGATSGFRLEVVPLGATGLVGAYDHFEVFDAFLDPESEDVDRDGDLGRGRFIGIAGTATPGPLNQPRFLHAAAAIPARPGQVLLAGGLGSEASATSYEIFDADRAGGFGVYRGGGSLSVPRPMPGAVALQETQVWIFGGGVASSDAELADVWQVSEDDPNGTLAPASDAGEFPHAAPAGSDSHPEYALVRPVVAAIDGAQRALVVGWYGPQCAIGMDTPLFPDVDATEYCNSPMTPRTASFTVSAATGLAASTPVRPHTFASSAALFPFDPDSGDEMVAITGGAANRLFSAQSAIDVFTGAVDASGAASQQSVSGATLLRQRLMHSSTGIPGRAIVTVGGFRFSSASLDRVTVESDIEVVFVDL